MSDRQRPTSSDEDGPPRTYWAQASEGDAPGPGRLIRRAWHLYRSTPRRLLLAALAPELIRDLLAIPGLVMTLGFVEGFVAAIGDYWTLVIANPAAYRADPSVFQAELEEQLSLVLVPPPDLALVSAATGAAALVVSLIGISALVAIALTVARGRPIGAVEAFRLVVSRPAIVGPSLALGLGWAVVWVVPLLLGASPDFQAWAGEPGSPRAVLIASLLSVLAVMVAVLVVIVAVRWALYVPAVVAESLGVGPALARSANLSRGIRVRLGLAMAGIFVMHAVSVGLVAVVVGIAMGLSAGSVAVGFGSYLATALVGNLLWAPVMPAMLAVAYDMRAADGTGRD